MVVRAIAAVVMTLSFLAACLPLFGGIVASGRLPYSMGVEGTELHIYFHSSSGSAYDGIIVFVSIAQVVVPLLIFCVSLAVFLLSIPRHGQRHAVEADKE